jgi:serine phosphatase RsbU (regulator of sigma subunit)
MGKGLPAALLMATVRAALEAVGPHSPPDRAVAAVAATVERDLERVESFVTLFHARVDAITRRVDFVDAGHGHVFVRRSGGVFEALGPRALPLGVLPAQQYPAGSIVLDPGDTLVVYSDGLLDARPERHLTAERVSAGLDDGNTAEETLDRLIGLADPAESLPDDLTVIVLRCQGAHFATRSTPAPPQAVPVAR